MYYQAKEEGVMKKSTFKKGINNLMNDLIFLGQLEELDIDADEKFKLTIRIICCKLKLPGIAK